MQPRLVKLRAYLRKHKIEVAIFFSATNDPNFVYFTKSDASGILVVPASSKPFIITNKMEFERLVRGSIIREIVVSDGKRISTIISKRVPRIARIGINKSSVTVRVLEELKRNLKARYVDVGEFCARLTQIKLREEIQAITRSCKITERIFTETIKG
ncbi:aminopeptidase P family N-terminal domain-containing protein, partial [Candidatus Woesearchaeota archaeon]|nr:aminopeptidase P family N-terminal domain-containing protein [Candidatus Woesearchaeota archaeon]